MLSCRTVWNLLVWKNICFGVFRLRFWNILIHLCIWMWLSLFLFAVKIRFITHLQSENPFLSSTCFFREIFVRLGWCCNQTPSRRCLKLNKQHIRSRKVSSLVHSSSEIKHCSNDNGKCHDKSAFSSAVRPAHPQYEAMHIDTVGFFLHFSMTRRVAFLGQQSFTFCGIHRIEVARFYRRLGFTIARRIGFFTACVNLFQAIESRLCFEQ